MWSLCFVKKDNAENEAILHSNEKDQAQFLSKKNESLTLQVVITALNSALEAGEMGLEGTGLREKQSLELLI